MNILRHHVDAQLLLLLLLPYYLPQLSTGSTYSLVPITRGTHGPATPSNQFALYH